MDEIGTGATIRGIFCVFSIAACGGGEDTSTDGGQWKPADPAEVTTELAPVVGYDIFEASSFLWANDSVIKGLDPRALRPHRFAVLRGRVLGGDGQGLSGVRVSISGHPELGWTLTRDDGRWDLAANGGERTGIVFEKEGDFTARRDLEPSRREFSLCDDVVLVAKPEESVGVDLSSDGAGAVELRVR